MSEFAAEEEGGEEAALLPDPIIAHILKLKSTFGFLYVSI